MTDKLLSSPHPIRDAAEANPSRRRFVRGVEIKKEIEAR